MFSQTFRIAPCARPVGGARARRHFAVAVSVIAAACAATPATATTLFQEDFENYAVGSNITGQGGWVPDYVNSAINVGNGIFLPTKVLNGLARTNSAQNFSARPLGFAFDPSRTTTFAFDAYAKSGATHNGVIGLGNSSIPVFVFGGPYWQNDFFQGTTGAFLHNDLRASQATLLMCRVVMTHC